MSFVTVICHRQPSICVLQWDNREKNARVNARSQCMRAWNAHESGMCQLKPPLTFYMEIKLNAKPIKLANISILVRCAHFISHSDRPEMYTKWEKNETNGKKNCWETKKAKMRERDGKRRLHLKCTFRNVWHKAKWYCLSLKNHTPTNIIRIAFHILYDFIQISYHLIMQMEFKWFHRDGPEKRKTRRIDCELCNEDILWWHPIRKLGAWFHSHYLAASSFFD